MILFTILAIGLVFLTILAFVTLGVGGAIFIVMFADVIVCIAFIVWLIKYLRKKKR